MKISFCKTRFCTIWQAWQRPVANGCFWCGTISQDCNCDLHVHFYFLGLLWTCDINWIEVFYLCNNTNDKFYQAINALYDNTLSCLRLNGKLTPWFQSTTGVRQGDALSQTLFSIYINDLARGVKFLNLRVSIDSERLRMLLNADDIVILAENEVTLQGQILWRTGAQSGEWISTSPKV